MIKHTVHCFDDIPLRPSTQIHILYEIVSWKTRNYTYMSVYTVCKSSNVNIGQYDGSWLWKKGLELITIETFRNGLIKTNADALAYNLFLFSDTGCANQARMDFSHSGRLPYWSNIIEQIKKSFEIAKILFD